RPIVSVKRTLDRRLRCEVIAESGRAEVRQSHLNFLRHRAKRRRINFWRCRTLPVVISQLTELAELSEIEDTAGSIRCVTSRIHINQFERAAGKNVDNEELVVHVDHATDARDVDDVAGHQPVAHRSNNGRISVSDATDRGRWRTAVKTSHYLDERT